MSKKRSYTSSLDSPDFYRGNNKRVFKLIPSRNMYMGKNRAVEISIPNAECCLNQKLYFSKRSLNKYNIMCKEFENI